MNMLKIDDIDASKDYARLHCHGLISKLKKRGILRNSPFHLGQCWTLLSGTAVLQVSEAVRRFEFHGTCAYLLLCLWQNFRIFRPHIFCSSLGCCVALKCGFWHRRWRGLQAQVPRFLMTTTSFKDFEVDSRLFTIRIPSLLSLVASRSSVYI